MQGDYMKKILVPTDGSECSKSGIDTAIDLANKYSSELVILHVIDNTSAFITANHDFVGTMLHTGQAADPAPGGSTGKPPVLVAQSDLWRNMEIMAEGILESAKARCAKMGNKVTTAMVKGHPAESIVAFAEHHDVDLIVMCSHGMSGSRIKRFFMGSVAHKVAVLTDKPIYIVR